MKVLTIGSDANLFKADSPVAGRIKKYGALAEELHIIVFTKQGYQNTRLADNVYIYPTTSASKIFFIFDGWRLAKRIVREKKIDLVSTQDPFESAFLGIKLKKKFGIKLQIQIHGNFFQSDYWRSRPLFKIRKHLAKYCLPKADGVRVVSRQIQESLSQFKIPREKIYLLPIHEDYSKYLNNRPSFDLHRRYPGKFIILWVGRLSREKNLDLLIDSFKIVNRKFNQTVLLLAGEGPEKEKLKNQAKRLKLESAVVFYPWQDDLVSFYKTSDLFVLCSKTEGYNRSVVEAMASGLPVIMTNVGPAGELVKNMVNGWVLEKPGVLEITSALVTLIQNEDLRKKIAEQAAADVQKLPNEKEYLALYLKGWQLAQQG
ncbi:MAG: hypothetical protein A2927_00750 [Candidatus Komeilibacteria bacterium RIFCSPLOWO2_01_FULL_45_10]|uniref:Glycosyl transferase family 1 domain-containing protein n=1 Tax=Candidatus Komeilibacteria bacterium RIFCSPLOWO2_01_FULL_45_10 TaxID=1798550 RepID=A0A1G2BJQ7_9BACT|nr:MAG: hypothetical protein A2927_00750 [Candidatus Komeilibacteria bacterium RIFCSPLOWO2_01_FULL_45_10]